MQFIQQDITQVERGIIVHQVNCQGVMGAGLAKQIKQKFPKAFNEYNLKCKGVNPLTILGHVQVVQVSDDLFIANAFGQMNYGTSKKQTYYPALDNALKHLRMIHSSNLGYVHLPVYFPDHIGCGLAGGDWNIVLPIIESHFPDAIICKL